MAHYVSTVLRDAIYRGNTERVFIVLIAISHPSLAFTIRMTSDGRNTTHKGETYEPFAFNVSLPSDREAAQPEAQLEIPNLDLRLIEAIRSIEGPAQVRIVVVLDDDTDRVERGPWIMELVNVTYDIESVRGTIRAPSLLSEPYPSATYNTEDYPGL